MPATCHTQAEGSPSPAGYGFPRSCAQSFLRTVRTLYGLAPLGIDDAAALPMIDAFARQPAATAYSALSDNVAMERNPGSATTSFQRLDDPDARTIAEPERASVRDTPGARRTARR